MTQEEKAKAYDEALTIAKRIISKNCSEVEKLCLKCIFPELAESEDEKMINELQGFLDSFGADYFGTGEWQKFHDWLEKQKDLAAIPDELIKNYKLFCKNGRREVAVLINAINGINEQKDQKPAEWSEDSVKIKEAFKAGRESGLRDGQKYVLNNLDSYGLCKLAEWSEEDECNLKRIIRVLEDNDSDWKELCDWLKSLRPSWKPSEEQMNALYNVINPCDHVDKKALESLYKQLEKLI